MEAQGRASRGRGLRQGRRRRRPAVRRRPGQGTALRGEPPRRLRLFARPAARAGQLALARFRRALRGLRQGFVGADQTGPAHKPALARPLERGPARSSPGLPAPGEGEGPLLSRRNLLVLGLGGRPADRGAPAARQRAHMPRGGGGARRGRPAGRARQRRLPPLRRGGGRGDRAAPPGGPRLSPLPTTPAAGSRGRRGGLARERWQPRQEERHCAPSSPRSPAGEGSPASRWRGCG